jgi:hypothetical protein
MIGEPGRVKLSFFTQFVLYYLFAIFNLGLAHLIELCFMSRTLGILFFLDCHNHFFFAYHCLFFINIKLPGRNSTYMYEVAKRKRV